MAAFTSRELPLMTRSCCTVPSVPTAACITTEPWTRALRAAGGYCGFTLKITVPGTTPWEILGRDDWRPEAAAPAPSRTGDELGGLMRVGRSMGAAGTEIAGARSGASRFAALGDRGADASTVGAALLGDCPAGGARLGDAVLDGLAAGWTLGSDGPDEAEAGARSATTLAGSGGALGMAAGAAGEIEFFGSGSRHNCC